MISKNGSGLLIPPPFIAILIFGLNLINLSIILSSSSNLVASAQIPIVLTPNSSLISLATASAFSTLISIIAISAPALASPLASAEQICPPPPITAAALPTNENNSE